MTMEKSIEKPIFLVGTGRSGTTLSHRVLSQHPEIAWLSALLNKFPNRPQHNRRLLQLLDRPIVGAWIQERLPLGDGECYPFWSRYYPGFSRPIRDLVAEDVTERTRLKIGSLMEQMLTPKRRRLLVKITGWPRLGFLQAIFPDARFLHIVRDGRAVANSLLNVDFWEGWRGPSNWRWGKLSHEYEEIWQRYDQSFVALAAINWELLTIEMDQARQLIPSEQFFEFRYEDLCDDPNTTLRNMIDFCELEWSDEFEHAIKRHAFKNTNHKWRKDLTANQQQILNEILTKRLKYYNYV
ncbi:MAG: sulfotransferase [Chloroflexota bacterium]